LRHPQLLRRSSVLEAPAAEILRHAGGDQLALPFASAPSGPVKVNAIERMIDFYGGVGTFRRLATAHSRRRQ